MSKNAKDNGSLFDLSIHTCSKSNTAKLIKHKKLIDNDLSSHRTSIRSSSSSSSSSSASTFTSSCQQEKENNRKKSNISSRFSRLKLFGKRKSSSVQKDLQQQQQQQEQQQKQSVSTATTSSKSKSISNWSKLKSR